MSSFCTNRATRQGKRSRTEGTSVRNALASGKTPEGENILYNTGMGDSVRRTTLTYTTIGSDTSKGLTIVGGLAYPDHMSGSNPNDREIPLGTSGVSSTLGDTYGVFPDTAISDPEYPIQLSGPGHLKFPQPIAIPVIRGNVHVTGALTWQYSTAESSASSLSIEDSLGNSFTGIANAGVIVRQGGLRYVSMGISWTGRGVAAGALFVTGLPVPAAIDAGRLHIVVESGLASSYIGGTVQLRYNGTGYALVEKDCNSGATETALTSANFSTGGTIYVVGWLGV